MQLQSYVVSMLIAVLASATSSFPVLYYTRNTVVHNTYCATLESPKLLENMKPIIRRDCLGQLDREIFFKSFFSLLPMFIIFVLVFNYFYNDLEDKLQKEKDKN
jgi:hypothetical protein